VEMSESGKVKDGNWGIENRIQPVARNGPENGNSEIIESGTRQSPN